MKDSASAMAYRALAQACMNANPKELGAHAFASLEKARTIDSSDAETFYLIWLQTDNENPESPYIRKSFSLNADFFQSHYGAGLLYSKRKEFDRAISEYKECVRINASHPLPYYSLGHAYSQQKKYDLAIPEYEKVLDLDKELLDAHFFLGVACYYEHQDKKAVKNFKRYLELVPDTGYRKQIEGMLREIQ
jgi:tetratricopeptide (TPR) repeat protein